MKDRIAEILTWYQSDSPGTRTNLARILNHGRLGGTGRLVILPVDQGFEHGPARSFAPNPAGYHPHYHFKLAMEAGCNAYAAPLGFLEAGAAEFAGKVPLILKLNNHDALYPEKDPVSAVTGSVRHALRLGCSAIGFTVYPGSSGARTQYEQLRYLAEEAKSVGLAVVVWSYPRGSHLSKEGETGIDVVAYAAELMGMPPPPEIAFADADLTPIARSFYEGSRRIKNARIKSELGVKLRYPTYREGLTALLVDDSAA